VLVNVEETEEERKTPVTRFSQEDRSLGGGRRGQLENDKKARRPMEKVQKEKKGEIENAPVRCMTLKSRGRRSTPAECPSTYLFSKELLRVLPVLVSEGAG